MARTESPLKAREAGETTGKPAQPAAYPLDANGEPLIQITFQASELIGLANYSNITVGPANITMFVAKGQEEALSKDEAVALANAINQVAEILEVDVLAVQRDIALSTIDPGKR